MLTDMPSSDGIVFGMDGAMERDRYADSFTRSRGLNRRVLGWYRKKGDGGRHPDCHDLCFGQRLTCRRKASLKF